MSDHHTAQAPLFNVPHGDKWRERHNEPQPTGWFPRLRAVLKGER